MIKSGYSGNKQINNKNKLKKKMGHEGDGDTNYNRSDRYSNQRIDKRTGGLENKRTSGNHKTNSVIKIGRILRRDLGKVLSLKPFSVPIS